MSQANLISAITSAPLSMLDEIAHRIWKAHAAGQLEDSQAQHLAEMIHVRKQAAKSAQDLRISVGSISNSKSIFPPKRRHRCPDKLASKMRRRTIAYSGPLPPTMAARFTPGQLAVLGIVGDEIVERGSCTLTMGEIAARAGVSHRLAQDAVRLAKMDDLIFVVERPQRGGPNLPNIITICSREWGTWLEKRAYGRRGGGCRLNRPTDNQDVRKYREKLLQNIECEETKSKLYETNKKCLNNISKNCITEFSKNIDKELYIRSGIDEKLGSALIRLGNAIGF